MTQETTDFERGAEAMRQAAMLLAAERGAYASNDMDADSLVDRLEARGRMDMANELRNALSTLPPPEDKA